MQETFENKCLRLSFFWVGVYTCMGVQQNNPFGKDLDLMSLKHYHGGGRDRHGKIFRGDSVEIFRLPFQVNHHMLRLAVETRNFTCTCLMYCAWTHHIRYKYTLYIPTTTLICASSLDPWERAKLRKLPYQAGVNQKFNRLHHTLPACQKVRETFWIGNLTSTLFPFCMILFCKTLPLASSETWPEHYGQNLPSSLGPKLEPTFRSLGCSNIT